jgi:hypothetical protein
MLFVYLVDPMATIGDPRIYAATILKLQSYFDKVAARLKPADTIRVAFIPATPAPTATDILIYYVPPEFSIVAEFAGEQRNPTLNDNDGWTFLKSGAKEGRSAASEVYARILTPNFLAALASTKPCITSFS